VACQRACLLVRGRDSNPSARPGIYATESKEHQVEIRCTCWVVTFWHLLLADLHDMVVAHGDAEQWIVLRLGRFMFARRRSGLGGLSFADRLGAGDEASVLGVEFHWSFVPEHVGEG
jgi:hypothetical protein